MTDAHGDQMTYAQVDHEMAKAHEDHLIHPDAADRAIAENLTHDYLADHPATAAVVAEFQRLCAQRGYTATITAVR